MTKITRTPRPRRHLSIVGLQTITLRRYRKALSRFFDFLSRFSLRLQRNSFQLDLILSEYIHHLYNTDQSETAAADTISAPARLFPRCRRAIPTSWSFLNNWRKTISRSRALPCSASLCRALATIALLKSDVAYALALLIVYSA